MLNEAAAPTPHVHCCLVAKEGWGGSLVNVDRARASIGCESHWGLVNCSPEIVEHCEATSSHGWSMMCHHRRYVALESICFDSFIV